ncbi:uncharacterized protein C17orf67 homolog isoform X1 [Oryctolagus cuniculus]|uniref:uncharacterized protein C17orf67 homolog isoform X1 n=1 Tax=Oryctolagus cuniculus TaxID=9986 RepID=UPI00048D9691|nr:uncharacterized protein C17orf67 homolog isoform X1 [Oryctolagus cuniculus]XP_051681445.1 uncharacterized protein C17orf67 homolog isoform X1 [Oryctolagus cuniculus]XP_051681446.1 uncharacterized protein C17orf67 homolog isoform X1 [Oryctolagus cuniculus]
MTELPNDTVLSVTQTCDCITAEASPLLLTEKQAKQLLRSRRQERPRKAGFRDEPMREYMLHLLALEHRAEEQFLEHWLNPHCKPHCDRNRVHPV